MKEKTRQMSGARKTRATAREKKREGAVEKERGKIFPKRKRERERKAQRTCTGTLKGPDAACESLRGRVDVPDGAPP